METKTLKLLYQLYDRSLRDLMNLSLISGFIISNKLIPLIAIYAESVSICRYSNFLKSTYLIIKS